MNKIICPNSKPTDMSAFSKVFDNLLTRQYYFACSLGGACPICKGQGWYDAAIGSELKGYARIDLSESEIDVLLKLLRGTEGIVSDDWKSPHKSAMNVLHAGLAHISKQED